jgi:hypothetical protein
VRRAGGIEGGEQRLENGRVDAEQDGDKQRSLRLRQSLGYDRSEHNAQVIQESDDRIPSAAFNADARESHTREDLWGAMWIRRLKLALQFDAIAIIWAIRVLDEIAQRARFDLPVRFLPGGAAVSADLVDGYSEDTRAPL